MSEQYPRPEPSEIESVEHEPSNWEQSITLDLGTRFWIHAEEMAGDNPEAIRSLPRIDSLSYVHTFTRRVLQEIPDAPFPLPEGLVDRKIRDYCDEIGRAPAMRQRLIGPWVSRALEHAHRFPQIAIASELRYRLMGMEDQFTEKLDDFLVVTGKVIETLPGPRAKGRRPRGF